MGTKSRINLILLGAVVGLPWMGFAAHPDHSPGCHARGVLVRDLRNDHPAFAVRVDVDKASRRYFLGETMTVTVRSASPGYLYLLYLQADGTLLNVFPNAIQSKHVIEAYQDVTMPADGSFTFEFQPPVGQETLKAIVSKKPLTLLDDQGLTDNPVTLIDVEILNKLRADRAKASAPTWAEHDVQLNVVDPKHRRPSQDRRRVAVLIGISEFMDKSIPSLGVCHLDAIRLSRVLTETCGFDKALQLTNSDATYARIRSVIADQLAAITRPGDDILIYWSGHGTRITDTNEDEPDGKDEVLIPYDARSNDLARTGVVDDAFGRWLQELDGRNIAIILDACYGGGAARGRGVTPVGGRVKGYHVRGTVDIADPGVFDFFDGEVCRAKDIGQKNVVLLASSKATEESFVRREDDLSVMTYYLLQILKSPSDGIQIQDAFEQLHDNVARYVRANFPGKIQTPLIVGEKPIDFWLKRPQTMVMHQPDERDQQTDPIRSLITRDHGGLGLVSIP